MEDLKVVAKEISELENKSEEEIYTILKTVKMLNDVEKREKTEQHDSGLFGDDDVFSAYSQLYDAIEKIIPDSRTSLTVQGTKQRYIAKAKILENKARNLRIAIEGICG